MLKLLSVYVSGVVYMVITGTIAGFAIVGLCWLLHHLFGG